jgi:hypothetical protein
VAPGAREFSYVPRDPDFTASLIYDRLGRVDAAERFAASSVRRWAEEGIPMLRGNGVPHDKRRKLIPDAAQRDVKSS